jgi:hypothetical protein
VDPCGVDCILEFEYDELAEELDDGFGGGGGGRSFFRGGMGDLWLFREDGGDDGSWYMPEM